jgi:hypothetical protein
MGILARVVQKGTGKNAHATNDGYEIRVSPGGHAGCGGVALGAARYDQPTLQQFTNH